MSTDPSRALATGSPGLAMLMIGLGGAVVSRAILGRTLLGRGAGRQGAALPDTAPASDIATDTDSAVIDAD